MPAWCRHCRGVGGSAPRGSGYSLVLTSSGSHCSGQYASYWNAFLLEEGFGVNTSQTTFIFNVRKQSLGQGNVFTPVCHSVNMGGLPTPPPPYADHPLSRYMGYGQQAGGTYPTIMHTCYGKRFYSPRPTRVISLF